MKIFMQSYLRWLYLLLWKLKAPWTWVKLIGTKEEVNQFGFGATYFIVVGNYCVFHPNRGFSYGDSACTR